MTVTTYTFPSLPGCVLTTRASGHFVGAKGSSLRHTMSPVCRSLEGVCHSWNFHKLSRYSLDQRVHECWTRRWQSCHLFNSPTLSMSPSSGNTISGLPIKKCLGVNTSSASDASGRGVSGREFKQASTCTKMVVNSSKFSLTSPIPFTNMNLEGFDCCLPQSTEVWSVLRDEGLFDILGNAEFCSSFCRSFSS